MSLLDRKIIGVRMIVLTSHSYDEREHDVKPMVFTNYTKAGLEIKKQIDEFIEKHNLKDDESLKIYNNNYDFAYVYANSVEEVSWYVTETRII